MIFPVVLFPRHGLDCLPFRACAASGSLYAAGCNEEGQLGVELAAADGAVRYVGVLSFGVMCRPHPGD